MIVVLVNPQTKQPTGFEPHEDTPRYFTGPYQNVTRVSESWLEAERERVAEMHAMAAAQGIRVPPSVIHGFTPNTETSRTDAAVAAERERCAKILSDYADARAYDPEEHDDLMEVVSKIRSGQ